MMVVFYASGPDLYFGTAISLRLSVEQPTVITIREFSVQNCLRKASLYLEWPLQIQTLVLMNTPC